MKWKDYIKKRWLYFIGYLFIYVLPICLVLGNIKFVKTMQVTPKSSISFGWCLVGGIYLIFASKFIKKKILALKPSAFRSFLSGLQSLIPVTVLAALVQVIQDVYNNTVDKMPKFDFAQYIWYIIISVLIGLILQVVDAFINRKFLYDLEIEKLARQQVDIETKKEELIKAKEE